MIVMYLHYKKKCDVEEKLVLMLSDSRSSLSGNLEFLDAELKKRDYEVNYFFKANLKATKTKKEKKNMCRLIAQAKFILVDDFYPLIYPIPLRKETKLIQVWHAMGAFKTVGFSRLGKVGGPNPRSLTHRNYTAAIVSSESIRKNYAEAFQMDIKNVYATGIPRTDIFFDEQYGQDVRVRIYERYPMLSEKKVILFAPTFRGDGQQSAHYNFEWLDFKALKDSLSDDYIFALKLHPFINNIEEIPKDDSFFINLTEEREINDLLFVTDVLITDYSSVIFESSLLNIPTVFFVPDLQEYVQSRDFYYPFEKYTYGLCAEDCGKLISAIRNPQNDNDKLEVFREFFCGSCDGFSTQRVVKTLFLEE